ncbi:MAG: DUF2723 domain-containing protein [Chloroflexota bacterium]
MKPPGPISRYALPVVLAVGLFSIYLATLAPGLTWANDGADGGDLITAAATGGVPHPSGYPVYLLVARLFQFIPIGPLAFRTNLLSALAAVAASLLAYGIVTRLPDSPSAGDRLAGFFAGLSFGLSPILWSQAVITEVYTLHAAFVALAIFLALRPPPRVPERLDRLRGLVSGLAVGNHLTAVFLLPVALLGGWSADRKIAWKSLGRVSAWLGAGLLVYLTLPLRALSRSPVNWGNPVSLENFLWLVTGELYQGRLFDIGFAEVLQRLQAIAALLVRQFDLPGISLALIGLIYFFKPTRLYFVTLYIAAVFSLFTVFYTSFDSYVYLIPVFLSFSIWIGLGIGGLARAAGRFARSYRTLAWFLLPVFFLSLAVSRWPQVDASRDTRAGAFGARMMDSLPENAVIFADGDRAIFALWTFHFALGQRPDLTVIATDLIHFDWYAESLRETYPSTNFPEAILWKNSIIQANPSRPICDISYFSSEDYSCKMP